MKKTIIGLTAVAALTTAFAFAPTPASARDDGWRGGDRHHYSRHYDRRHWRHRDRDGVYLQFGSPARCYTYWRHGRKYRSCEPGGVTFGFGF